MAVGEATTDRHDASGTKIPDDEATCANCGTDLVGHYCHACGQKSHLYHSLLDLFRELLESFVHFDGRFWRTLPPLALDPGKLSREWREGRRRKYLAPLPLFLFATFLLFAIPGVTGRQLLPVPDAESVEAAIGEGSAAHDHEHDSATFRFGHMIGQRIAHVSQNNRYYSLKFEDLAYKSSVITVPISMAILGVVIGFRRRFRFYDHAVVALYGMGFLTLLIALATLVPGTIGRLIASAALFIAPVHAVIHLRGAYGLSWLGAILRGVMLGLLSVVAFVMFFLGVFALGMFS